MELTLEKITNGVKVSLSRGYISEHSKPELGSYFFVYTITITNCRSSSIQLLRRKWKITDFAHFVKTVEGEGVVGKTPILEPGESHTYSSYCELVSGMGEMEGFYTFFDFHTFEEFDSIIPTFQLIAPWKLN